MADPTLNPTNPLVLAALQQQQAQTAPPPVMPDASVLAPPGAPPPPPATVPAFAQEQATALAADKPQVTENKPGPVKSFLQNFLMGAGDAARKHVGLETQAEQEQRQFQQGIAQQNANTNEGYRQALTGHLQAQADQLTALQAPVIVPLDFPIKGLAGKQMTQGAYQGILKAIPQYQGRVDSAGITADSRESVAGTQAASRESIAAAQGEVKKAIAQGNWRLAAQRLGTATGNLNLRQLEYRMRAYGTGADGQPLPGIEFDATGRPVGTAMQTNVRPTTTARNAAERADSMQDIEGRIRGALNDPQIRAGLGPMMGRVSDIKGQAGVLDGPLAELRNDLVSYGAFQAGLHPVRGIGALQYFDKVMGGLGQTPEELLGKMASNTRTAQSVQRVARPVNPGSSSLPATAPTGSDPFAAFGGKSR